MALFALLTAASSCEHGSSAQSFRNCDKLSTANPEYALAQQGLLVVAGKLVLDAHTAIDNGKLDQAAGLLADARALDPASRELSAAATELDSARERQLREEREAAQTATRSAEADLAAAAAVAGRSLGAAGEDG